MNRKGLLLICLIPLLIPLAAETDSDRGTQFYLAAAEDLLSGRWDKALEGYGQASLLLEGEWADLSKLRILQLKLELGQFSGLGEECRQFIDGTNYPSLAHQALLVEIFYSLRVGRREDALVLMEEGNGALARNPSTALMLSEAYRSAGEEEEASRLEWIIKRDFPSSPECLILRGGSDRGITPRSLLP